MSFPEDYLNDDYDSYYDEDETKLKIQECKQIIDNGHILANIDFIEDTIQLCLEHDFVPEGLALTDALIEIAPYNSEAWQYKGILLNNSFNFEQAYYCFQKHSLLIPTTLRRISIFLLPKIILECLKMR
jgi:hypothetical protein